MQPALDQELSLFEKVLLATDGTVTDLIALYAGEPIRVHKLEQWIRAGVAPTELDCAGLVQLLVRRILLSGAKRNYLYAESQFVVDRVPTSIREAMLETDRPIGLLWKDARLETFRELVTHSIGPSAAIAAHFDVAESHPFVSRTYRVYHVGKAFGLITEQWPLHSLR